MDNKQKLELTWIGKGEEPKLEPRILIEDSEKSYGDKNIDNLLVQVYILHKRFGFNR